ncbi:hypothetical protein GUITHDRAFT_89299 [Guillardia theta CCMP2712]|uniref:Phytanoyl-CoA dioxygenase n=1 Tax=Guillardia theta (strain CCMP2712) TaxID=905079 RepID=L1IRD2_GUITC|nr:hypothetical protein GUITHDRAFT_89299 [Guillardia theta CCMP2712]EKX38662.1 hypothetical protein GUITHDRAFT_89299 [Guillardia theta CCMP2712]|eukprot:XP_005825642.1 hypothetical protein GUITHDRAFT_89299 [Guillardia theta CCMP2712]
MLSQPGSQTQQWHSDGDHLSEHEHLPPYAVNIFVPLVDMNSALGPTEFVPTTHLLFNYEPITSITPITICTPAGECLFFDYRIKHRGLGNRGHYARPMLYITYGTKAWADKANFSKKRYAKLPPLLNQRPPRSQLPVDREDRMKLLEATTSPDKKGGKKRTMKADGEEGEKPQEESKDGDSQKAAEKPQEEGNEGDKAAAPPKDSQRSAKRQAKSTVTKMKSEPNNA